MHINQFTAIMTTHVVMADVCKVYDMSIFKKELLWNQLRYLDGVKTIKILIKIVLNGVLLAVIW